MRMSHDRPGGRPAPDASTPAEADEDSVQPPFPGAVRHGWLYSLSFPNFRLLWIGHASHAGALWMEQIARPWLVLLMTGDNAAHVGGVVAMRTLPQLLFGLWAGVVADRFDRRLVLLGTKIFVLTLTIVFTLILLTGRMELWMVYAFSFLRGSSMAFDQPARQSLIGSFVPADALTNAVALMSSTQNVMRLIGVIASGAVITFLGIEGAFILITLIYVPAVISTWRLQVEPTRNGRPRTSMMASLVEGLRYAVTQPAILGVMVLSFFFFAFGMSWMQVFAPLFARTVFEIEAIGLSFLVAIATLGALFATYLIASRYPKRLGLILPGTTVVMGAMLALFAAASYLPGNAGLVVPLLMLPVVGMTQVTYNSLSNALLLSAAPPELRGRVISLISLDRAMMSAGAALGGLLAATAGVQVAQIAYGLVLLAAGVAVLFLAPSRRTYRAP
jgi:MFS family permease